MTNDLGIKIFRQEAKFVAGVARIDQFPKLYLPQVAFIGKSNVGKSSLINSICRRKNLARVSHTPGRTQQINFFSIVDKLLLADLPGYGFAKVSKSQKADWERLMTYYLETSNHLRLVNLLIDSRRGIKDNDIDIMNMLHDFGKHFQIVLTKSDKEKVNEVYIADIKSRLAALGFDDCHVVSTSSKSGVGMKELQYSMLQF
ncbi:MAG: ribosome biogenesis GTP-binding protein YihA/YsxC [Pseudomonadota bacterium]